MFVFLRGCVAMSNGSRRPRKKKRSEEQAPTRRPAPRPGGRGRGRLGFARNASKLTWQTSQPLLPLQSILLHTFGLFVFRRRSLDRIYPVVSQKIASEFTENRTRCLLDSTQFNRLEMPRYGKRYENERAKYSLFRVLLSTALCSF